MGYVARSGPEPSWPPGGFTAPIERPAGAVDRFVRRYKARSFEALDLRPGSSVLDAGCGPGADAVALAERVMPGGRVVGVDTSISAISQARDRARAAGVPVDFVHSDVCALELADASFDAVRADRLLQCLADPRRAVRELARVARPGARVVVTEPDWGTLAIDAPQHRITARLTAFASDGVANAWSGRRLLGLFRETGLGLVALEHETLVVTSFDEADGVFQLHGLARRAQQAGVVSAVEAASWLAHLQDASAKGRFFAAVTGFGAVGAKAPA
jgi:SAM-dependent methyltransferase